jgi:hypothetical protein
MWNVRKYSAVAAVGAGLAFAAASPASACGAFGMVGVPVFGAAFGGCGAYGYAAPVAFGCGSYGYAPTYGYARSYGGYGGCGCGGSYGAAYGYAPHRIYAMAFRPRIVGLVIAHRPHAYGYAVAYRHPAGFAVAHHRPVGVAVAFHRPAHIYVAHRSHRPTSYAYSTRSAKRHIFASYTVKHRFG